MSSSNLFDTLQNIQDAVSDAARTGDFSGLNSSIQSSVADLANGVGDTVANGARDFADTIRGAGSRSGNNSSRSGSSGQRSGYDSYSGGESCSYSADWNSPNGSGGNSFNGSYGNSAGSSSSGRNDQTGRYTAFGNHQTNLHNGDAAYESPYRNGNATDQEIERIRREKAAREQGRWQNAGRQTVVDENGRPVRGRSYFLQTRPGSSQGLAKRVFGIGGTGIFGVSTMFWLIAMVAFIVAFDGIGGVIGCLIMTGVNAGLTALCVRTAKKGFRQKELMNQYYRYGKLVGDQEYFAIPELADKAGETPAQVRKNISDMHSDGMLPYAVMDRTQTTVMLTQHAYDQYAQAEESYQQREASGAYDGRGRSGGAGSGADRAGRTEGSFAGDEESGSGQSERTAGTKHADAASGSGKAAVSPEVRKILDDGNAYIREIRRINDEIPDTEEMSTKLYRLEDIMRRIFAQVQKDPSKAKDLRKLMNYYLPTTMKLLNAYVELNNQPEAGENIRSAKQEIDASMDTINDAFEKLLDNLFQDQAWDISSDLDVMKTMMAQDGLTDDRKKK